MDMQSGGFNIEVVFYLLRQRDPVVDALHAVESRISILEQFLVGRFAREQDADLLRTIGYEEKQLQDVEDQQEIN